MILVCIKLKEKKRIELKWINYLDQDIRLKFTSVKVWIIFLLSKTVCCSWRNESPIQWGNFSFKLAKDCAQ